eukprot:CAMPEP_0194053430 /NCGR_PEP_ID=MMETSP0009_2-20130614/49815_1 /TAXON_ID=210454 /ORGANISM="Grammatophora oceanica, Strain CCMP 410" /LENGTH=481 /DNA_ID=CAMNT_0038701513 /DNA_START=89 /DNA_END=1534 /DNA_ORIENTATION=-
MSDVDRILLDSPPWPPLSTMTESELMDQTRKHENNHNDESPIDFLNNQNLREIDFFSSAFWQSVPRFVNGSTNIEASPPTNIEGVTFQAILQSGHGKDDVRMTTNWLHFSLEHLSKWWRLVGDLIGPPGLEHAIAMLEAYTNRTIIKASSVSSATTRIMSSTVALIPFHLGFDTNKSELWERMDEKALTATIVSLMQFGVGRVVVVGHVNADAKITYKAFEELRLLLKSDLHSNGEVVPIHGTNLTGFFETKVGDTELAFISTDVGVRSSPGDNGPAINVPRGAVMGLQNALLKRKKATTNDADDDHDQQYQWLGKQPDQWKFVYHTEPDQILTGRPTQQFLDVMNDEHGVIIPHRLQPIPHWKDFESLHPDPRAIVGPDYSDKVHELDSRFESEGDDVCCDVNDHSGIDNKGNCQLFWWQCGFGHGNFSYLVHNKYEYMRLSQGGTGIVLLAATEHGRKCRPQRNDNICRLPSPPQESTE